MTSLRISDIKPSELETSYAFRDLQNVWKHEKGVFLRRKDELIQAFCEHFNMKMSPSALPASNEEIERLIPHEVTIPVTIIIQVTGLEEWPSAVDDEFAQRPWSELSSEEKRDIHLSVKTDVKRFDDWMDSDYEFATVGGGKYKIDTRKIISTNYNERPQIAYTGRYIIQPGKSPSIYIQNVSQSRNMLLKMLSGIFAHWDSAGNDQVSLVSVQFIDPDVDLRKPWAKYNAACANKRETEQSAMQTKAIMYSSAAEL
jgi:hypothetical protein